MSLAVSANLLGVIHMFDADVEKLAKDGADETTKELARDVLYLRNRARISDKRLQELCGWPEDLLRWRCAKTEKPEEPTTCLVILGENQYMDVTNYHGEGDWSTGIITWWRPIGPLPGGE